MLQLDTSTWLITIIFIILTPFITIQLKVSKQFYFSNPEPVTIKIKTSYSLRNKIKENLFFSFITPTIMGLPIIILIIIFLNCLFPSINKLISNHLIAIQQWLLHLTWRQIMTVHNPKDQIWILVLMSLTYWLNKSVRPFTHTRHTTTDKPRYGHSSMSRDSTLRIPP